MLLLVFSLKDIKIGIPLEEVEYIVDDVHNVDSAMASKHIRGTAILREEAIPIYSLMSRFGYEDQMAGKMVVVVGYEDKKLGLEVGDIDGIKYMEEFVFAEIPPIIQKEKLCIKHAISYQNQIILVLVLEKLIVET